MLQVLCNCGDACTHESFIRKVCSQWRGRGIELTDKGQAVSFESRDSETST